MSGKLREARRLREQNAELCAKLNQCVGALDALVAERPSLPGKIAGNTTVGNTIAEARAAIDRTVLSSQDRVEK